MSIDYKTGDVVRGTAEIEYWLCSFQKERLGNWLASGPGSGIL